MGTIRQAAGEGDPLTGRHWHCPNCGLGGIVGIGLPWHGPGSSLCPIQSALDRGEIKLVNPHHQCSQELVSKLAFLASHHIEKELLNLGHQRDAYDAHLLYQKFFKLLQDDLGKNDNT